MANVKHIIRLAESFHKMAIDAYFDAMMKRICSFATWGLASVKHMLAQPKYSKAPGLLAMQEKMPELLTACQQAKAEAPGHFLQHADAIMEGLTFYTSRGNAGTGMDEATQAKVDGYTPPAWYISNIQKMLGDLKKRYSEDPSDKSQDYV